jgi:Heterokaryon incompatibility protein (HET)
VVQAISNYSSIPDLLPTYLIFSYEMATYQYSKLVDEAKDIRLITLLPGQVDDEIKVTITHTPLIKPPERPTQRLSLEQVRETLPPGWSVYETTEGRYLFLDHETYQTSWAHPIPHIDRSSYELPPEDACPKYDPKYEALSYTWGTADSPETAYVTESPGAESSTLQIQQNLASALRHLRYHDSPRKLWVDAVCINQKDALEKNTQVTRMADIYRQAFRVVVWLGSESSNSKLAMSTLDYLGAQVETLTMDGRLSSPNSTHQLWHRSRCELPYNQATWQAILDIFNRPWFDRLWVTQEIHLANHRATMQCGYDQISWQHFRRAAMCTFAKRDIPLQEFSGRASELGSLMQYFPASSFYSLLRIAANRLCSDPRDKVYGLLGISLHPK